MNAASGTPHALRLIVRHEWRLLTRSRTFWVCVLSIAGLIGFATRNGAVWADHHRATIGSIQQHDDEKYRRIKADLADLVRRGDPHPALNAAGMVWYILQADGTAPPAPHIDPRRAEAAASEWVGARYAVLPSPPLAPLAIGQSDLHPYYSRVTIRTRPILVNSDELENPANLVNGRFDLAFVLTFCWPLLVMPLAYDMLADERDNGTLTLLASQPMGLRTLLAGKLLVRAGAMVILTAAASVVTLIGLAGVLPGSAMAVGLAAWVALIVVNGLLWFGMAAWVNSAGWRSGLNAIVLTVAWLGWVVVVPSAVGLTARAFAPVPSRVQLINEVRAAGNLGPQELTSLLTTYKEANPDVVPITDSADNVAIRGLALQDEVDRRIGPVLARYRASLTRQQRLVDYLRFASPAILTYDATTELAGTSTTRYRRFAEQLDDYHRAWRAYFYPLVHQRVTLAAAHYDRAPRFSFREAPSAAFAMRVWLPVAAIGSLGLLTLFLTVRALSRYPVLR
ncbi:MAG TPA: DUF3526 domain-containing protein [Vicinamibacterales bacterium]|nr:DUF3526 domain-containing protein [Vicinamibacterales bacterium]